MKSFKLSLLLLIAFLANTYTANATHFNGADITYKSLGNYKYEITIKLYRDCRGIVISAPSSAIKCGTYTVGTFTPTEISVRDITPTCSSVGKPCNPKAIGSSIGFEEHTYTYTFDFTTIRKNGCCVVTIGTGQCCRNNLTTATKDANYWSTAMIDLCQKTQNSSPVFYSEPKIITGCNQPVYYNVTARDFTDNDSLVYEFVDPMQDWTQNVGWNSGFSSQNPFTVYCPGGCNPASPKSSPPKGIYLDRTTGDMIFTPISCSESTPTAIRVSEYRKDTTGKYKLIGYVIRDYQWWIMNLPENTVPLIIGPDKIYVADSVESKYLFSTYDKVTVPKTGSPVLNDSVKLKMLVGATKASDTTFKVIDTKQKNPAGIFKWKPIGMSRNRPYIFVLEARDNACSYNAITHKSVSVFVRKKSELAWVEGTVYEDGNKNCKRDSFEKVIPGALVSTDGGYSISFVADSSGKYSGWYAADSCNLSITGNYNFNCSTKQKLTAGKSYTFDLGGIATKMNILGSIYYDTSKNCKRDSLEYGLKNQIVYTEPGGYNSSTDSKGQFGLELPAGDYKIMYKPKRFSSITCPSKPYTISVTKDSTYKNQDIAIFDTTSIVDLSCRVLSSNRFRWGFNNTVTLYVKNNGSKTISNAYIWVKHNKNLKYTSSSGYVSKNDSILKFSIPTLAANEAVSFNLILLAHVSYSKVKDTMTLQTWLDTSGLKTDRHKPDNYDKKSLKIVAAYDPNIKEEQNTKGYAYREGNQLRYFVQFQNTGTDTAVNITVTDTLHYALLGQTFVFNGASHPAEFTLKNNVLKVSFANINLPDTSTNKDKSIGHFEFSIDIDPMLNKEIKFYNQVSIYFDYAAAVKTNKEYTTYTSLVKTGQTNKNQYCSYDTIKVGYSSNFSFNSGNKFKLILSDKNGSFVSGTKIIDSTSSTSQTGNFKTTIPSGTAEGSQYKLKVVSTNPAGTIFDDALSNNFAIIGALTKPTFGYTDTFQCSKDSVKLAVYTSYTNFNIYDRHSVLSSSVNNRFPTFYQTTGYHYYVVKVNFNSCFISSDTLKVNNEKLPVVKLTSPSHPTLKLCGNDSVILDVSGCKKFDLLYNGMTYLNTYNTSPIKTVLTFSGEIRFARGYSDRGCTDTSNTLKFIRYNKPTVSLTLSDADLEICAGNNVVYTGKGATTYQLYKNDTAWLAKFTNTISSTNVKTTSKIQVEGTDNNGCKSSSNPIMLDVIPLPDVKLSCTDSDLNICKASSTDFSFSGANTYRLYKNNSFWLVPTSNPYTISNFADKDEFFIQGTSSKGCINNSNKIKLRLIETKVDLTLINTGAICTTDTVFLEFSGGVSYDVFKNNTLYKNSKGQKLASLDFSNGDVIFIEGTDSFGCKASSSSITINMVSKPTVVITNEDTDNTHCKGETVKLNLTGAVKYDLYKNNVLWFAGLGTKTNLTNFKDKDEIYAIGYSNSGCNNTSNTLKFIVLDLPTINISNPDTDNSHCKGDNVIINFSGGATYDLYKNNILWKPNTGSSVNFNDVNDKDEIYSVGIGANGCADTSNKIKFSVWPLPAKPIITKTGTVLSSSYTTGNQWYEGTTKLTGATSQNYSPVKSATYFVNHTDVNGCISPISDGYSFSVFISKVKLEGLKIYPNPASDHLIIETGKSGKFHISLIDITGKLVKEETFNGNHFEWQLKPAKGLYHLKIVNEKGESENVAVEFK